MGVERTTVVVNVEGEAQAAAAARRLEADADRVARKADVARAKVREADLAGRKLSLYERMRQKTGALSRGTLQLGPNGFSVDRGAMRATGFGGAVAVALAAMDVHARAVDSYLDYREQRLSVAESIAQVARETTSAAGHMASGALQFRTIGRIWNGYTRSESELAFSNATARIWGGEDLLEQAIQQQRLASREAAKIRRQQDAEDDAAAKKRTAFDAVIEKMDEALAARTAGMRAPQLPIRVPESMWHEMQLAARERERRRTEILKQRLSAGAGS